MKETKAKVSWSAPGFPYGLTDGKKAKSDQDRLVHPGPFLPTSHQGAPNCKFSLTIYYAWRIKKTTDSYTLYYYTFFITIIHSILRFHYVLLT